MHLVLPDMLNGDFITHSLVQDWFSELAIGFAKLVILQLLAGLWIATILHQCNTRSVLTRLVLGMTGMLLIASAAFLIFDPATHIIAAAIAGYALAFSAPLRAIQVLQEQDVWTQSHKKYRHQVETPSLRRIVATVCFPAAAPSPRHPPTNLLSLLITGILLLAVSILLSLCFPAILNLNSYIVTTTWCCTLAYTATWAITSLTSALFIIAVGVDHTICKPFYSPWSADSLASFWALHWNVPIHQALRDGIYSPLTKVGKGYSESSLKMRQGIATMLCFIVSGISHEAVLLFMGVPFGNSRGEWMGFFVAHGVAMLLEKQFRSELKKVPRGLRRLMTAGFVFASASLLFFPIGFRLGLLKAASDSFAMIPRLLQSSYTLDVVG